MFLIVPIPLQGAMFEVILSDIILISILLILLGIAREIRRISTNIERITDQIEDHNRKGDEGQ